MYDAFGADGGREWVEITNVGLEAVTISTSTWKFLEGETNHKLSLFQGSPTILSGGFAVIADDPKKFLTDWPQFVGTIFDSTFSLSQTGEILILKSSSTTVEDTVSYTGEKTYLEGNSLQKINGSWKSLPPTPGHVNQESKPKTAVVAAPVTKTVEPKKVTEVPVSKPKPAVSPVEVSKESGVQDTSLANVSNSTKVSYTDKPQVTSGTSVWFYALAGVIALGALGLFVAKPKQTTTESKADEYTILE
ncbi:MAG: hypothetical protein V4467_01725 [Patescibacteria group bacterium]